MKFVDRVKGKVNEKKEKIALARDKKQVREIIERLSAFPLCSESDAYWIIQGEVTRYFGRQDCFSLDLDLNPSDEEVMAEMDNLETLKGQMRVFLEYLFDPSMEYSPSLLKGSINVCFHSKILEYLEETEFPIEESTYISIMESMVGEASGLDIKRELTDLSEDDSKLALFHSHRKYKEKFFPNLGLIKVEKDAHDKLVSYLEVEEIAKPFYESEEEDSTTRALYGNPPVVVALASDTIGGGQPIKVLPLYEQEFEEKYVGQASVVRIIDYHFPFLLEKNHVLSLRSLSVDIKADESLHWHFCEDGILEIALNVNAIPRWLPANKVKKLVFGEAYDGMSKDGVTQFERYFLYMIVKTSNGPSFTLYKYLGKSSQKAMEAWSDLGEDLLPTLAEYYDIEISDEIQDVSKHYKTTYTTYTTTWSWG